MLCKVRFFHVILIWQVSSIRRAISHFYYKRPISQVGKNFLIFLFGGGGRFDPGDSLENGRLHKVVGRFLSLLTIRPKIGLKL